jgi:hypothetical protein
MVAMPGSWKMPWQFGYSRRANRAENIAKARALLNVAPTAAEPQEQPDIATDAVRTLPCPFPRCGARVIVIEVFAPGREPRWRPMPSRINTALNRVKDSF